MFIFAFGHSLFDFFRLFSLCFCDDWAPYMMALVLFLIAHAMRARDAGGAPSPNADGTFAPPGESRFSDRPSILIREVRPPCQRRHLGASKVYEVFGSTKYFVSVTPVRAGLPRSPLWQLVDEIYKFLAMVCQAQHFCGIVI
jgi:hypothetical protein